MPLTLQGRKLIHRGALNLVRVAYQVASGGATLSVKSAPPGVTPYLYSDHAAPLQQEAHSWNPSDGFLWTIQVAADAPLGPADILFQAAPDDKSQPLETAALRVTVTESPFSSPLPLLPGLPVTKPPAAPTTTTTTLSYTEAAARWHSNLTGPARSVYSSVLTKGFDGSESGPWYYDGVQACLDAAEVTGDASWVTLAQGVADGYLGLIQAHGGAVPGYYVFGRGLCNLYLTTRQQKYLDAALLLAAKSQFGRGSNLAYSATPDGQREAAYQLELELALAKAGQPPEALRIASLADLLLLQLDQLYLSQTWGHHKPFLTGLASRALLNYLEQTPYRDARVLPYLQAAAKGMMAGWVPTSGTWKYEWNLPGLPGAVDKPDERPAPDLNLLIAPVYAYTGDLVTGDAALSAAVQDPNAFSDGKHAGQQLYWGDAYLRWHDSPPAPRPA